MKKFDIAARKLVGIPSGTGVAEFQFSKKFTPETIKFKVSGSTNPKFSMLVAAIILFESVKVIIPLPKKLKAELVSGVAIPLIETLLTVNVLFSTRMLEKFIGLKSMELMTTELAAWESMAKIVVFNKVKVCWASMERPVVALV